MMLQRLNQAGLLGLLAGEDGPALVGNQTGAAADGREAFVGVVDAEMQPEFGA